MMKSTQRPRLASALTTTRRSLANAGLLRSQAHLEREPRFKDERINESTDEIDGERKLLRHLEEHGERRVPAAEGLPPKDGSSSCSTDA